MINLDIDKADWSSQFKNAMPLLMKLEGGYVNNPKDPGWATKYGISKRFIDKVLQANLSPAVIKTLTKEQANALYHKHFWLVIEGDEFDSEALASAVLQMAVVSGANTGVRLLQETLNILGANLKEDGIMGPKTSNAAGQFHSAAITAAYLIKCHDYLQTLPDAKFKSFTGGWENRIIKTALALVPRVVYRG